MALESLHIPTEYQETCSMEQEYSELLTFLQNNPPMNGEEIFSKRSDVLTVTEFSHCRENIASWIDIEYGANILEINAGCGAVTGCFLEKCTHIDCIEPSLVKTRINQLRHVNSVRASYFVGEFEQWQSIIPENGPYNYIFVWNADEKMLRNIPLLRKALILGGKLIITANNRYGLKYFAGCKTDDKAGYYANLMNLGFGIKYDDIKGIVNSRLNTLMMDDSVRATVYYPYPDTQFTVALYTKDYMPRAGELSTENYPFGDERLHLFDETAAYDTLIQDGMFEWFSNAYLILIENVKPNKNDELIQMLPNSAKLAMIDYQNTDRIIYTKFSNERDPKFNIRTDICETSAGYRYIRKNPISRESFAHVLNMYNIFEKLNPMFGQTNLMLNQSAYDEKGVLFEYIEGIPMDTVMDNCIAQGNFEALYELINAYTGIVYNIYGNKGFRITDEFTRIFGEVELPAGLVAGEYVDIDLIFSNIISDAAGWNIIDYEWTFNCLIPANYIIYRALYFFMMHHDTRRAALGTDIYQKLGITEKEICAYEKMETNFQKYTQGNYVQVVKRLIDAGVWNVLDIRKVQEDNDALKRNNEIILNDMEAMKNSRSWKLTKPLRREK